MIIPSPPRQMTRDDLYEYVRMLDSSLRDIFRKAETVVRETEIGPAILLPEFQIAKAVYDVFDGFAQRWFDGLEDQ